MTDTMNTEKDEVPSDEWVVEDFYFGNGGDQTNARWRRNATSIHYGVEYRVKSYAGDPLAADVLTEVEEVTGDWLDTYQRFYGDTTMYVLGWVDVTDKPDIEQSYQRDKKDGW